jgi:hypothetical protein
MFLCYSAGAESAAANYSLNRLFPSGFLAFLRRWLRAAPNKVSSERG